MTRPCCNRSRCGTTFQCTNGEMENGYCSQHMLGYLFPMLPKNNDHKGAKRNVPHLLQAQQAPICLRSISETLQCQKFRGTVTKSTISNRVCSAWSLKVLWGSVSADFRQFQVGGEGKKRKKDTGLTGRVNESK